MELKLLEKSKNKILIEIEGEDHTFCNALKEELNSLSQVKVASYRVKHPLSANPILLIEGDDPEGCLEEAAKKLQKNFSDIGSMFKSIRK